MMMNSFTFKIATAMLWACSAVAAQDSLIISEVADPGDDYAGRFIELYNAGSHIVDFGSSEFYLSRQSNGGTSWGDVRLTGTVGAGDTYVIGGSGFEALYGFAPDLQTGILIGNGDDAYCLFSDGDHSTGTLHDLFGVIDMDGTGEPWEYTDSRGVRVAGIAIPNITWTASEWEIAPAGLTDCDPGSHWDSGGPDSIPSTDSLTLTVGSVMVSAGLQVEIPVYMTGLETGAQIIAYQFELVYDTTRLEYTGYSLTGTVAEGGTVAVNAEENGRLVFGYMNTVPITGEGIVMTLQFNSLMLGSSDLLISDAFLNSNPVENLVHGRVTITETVPPTARVTYSDTVHRLADQLTIMATFSEPMDPATAVQMSLTGAMVLHDAEMLRLNDTVYQYVILVPHAEGVVAVRISGGSDLWGNIAEPLPTGGESFYITGLTPGDVDDDGMVLAYDAALTLQYSVGIDPLPTTDPFPWENWRDSTANVDGSPGITANDAGLILQFSAGLIPGFTGAAKKSVSAAEVRVEVMGNYIVFYSDGSLLGLNIRVENLNGILGMPEVLDEKFLYAYNISSTTYSLGLCIASPPYPGSAFLRIPFNHHGSVELDLIVNTEKDRRIIDLVTETTGPSANRIKVFPNPATDKVMISGLTSTCEIGIFNMLGTRIYSGIANSDESGLDLTALSPGTYVVRIHSNRETAFRKLLIRAK